MSYNKIKTSQSQTTSIKAVLTNQQEPSEMMLTLIDDTFCYLKHVTMNETASTASRLAAIKQLWSYAKWTEKYASQEQQPEADEQEFPSLRLFASS